MNKQTYSFLSLLLDSPLQTFTHEDLAAHFSVSTRSIRNYVNAVLSFLQEYNKEHLLKVSEKGISYTGTAADSQFLLSHMVDDDFYLYKLSPDERVKIILLKLLLSDDYLTLSALMKKFNVSRTTLLKDMEQIRKSLTRYNLSFPSTLNHGYLLHAEEEQRRTLILQLLYEPTENRAADDTAVNLYRKFFYGEYEVSALLSKLKPVLLQMEKKNNIIVSDENFDHVLLYTALMTIRVQKGHPIPVSVTDRKHLIGIATFQTAEEVTKELHQIYGIDFSLSEKDFLARQLYNYSFYNLSDIENTQDMKLHIALSDFLLKVGRELSLPIFEDTQTILQLERHLKDITHAHFNGIHFDNEYADQLIMEYDLFYQVIRKHIHILENCAGYSYDDNTISFILMYIVVASNHYFQNNILPGIIVVCHTGIGTANFLAQRLRANFHMNILAVTSNHKLPEIMEQYDFDLIVSTIQLAGIKEPWIRVSPILEDNDILLVQKKLMEITANKQRELFPTGKQMRAVKFSALSRIHPILKSENIILDVECRDWQEAVRVAAAPLLSEGSITGDYVNAMIESAKRNGAYFVYCKGVALVHAGPDDGIIRFGISLLRLGKPICFGHERHDPVTYVICLAACRNEPLLSKVLKIMDQFSRPELLQIFDHAKDPEALLHSMIRQEKEEINHEL